MTNFGVNGQVKWMFVLYFSFSILSENEYNGRYTDPSYERADVTSTYFLLIGYSHRELGRLVMNTFTWHEPN